MITLAWDEPRRVWTGSAELAPGHGLTLRISPHPSLELQRRWARALFDRIAAKERDLRLRVAQHKLPLYNSSWRDDAEPQLSEAEFADRLHLYSLVIYEPGQGLLFYRDGDLFAGHTLIATIDRRFDITGVELYG